MDSGDLGESMGVILMAFPQTFAVELGTMSKDHEKTINVRPVISKTSRVLTLTLTAGQLLRSRHRRHSDVEGKLPHILSIDCLDV